MSQRIVVAFSSGGLGLLLWLGCLACEAVPSVEVVEASESRITVRVATNGVIEPIEKLEVRARLDGRVVAVPEAGARIAAGELLLKIDAGPTVSLRARAESERLAAIDSLREAEDQLLRIQRRSAHDERLFRDQALTQDRFDEGQADLREAEARASFLRREVPLRVASLDLRIDELRAQQTGAEVRAAFSGIVYKTAAKPGQRVRSGDVIVWFADLKRPRVRANVDQVDLGRVRVGQEVEVSSNAYPGRIWSARIEELIPNVVRRESRFVAEALATIAPPAAGLMPGMRVDVEIAIETVPDALQVPTDAIFFVSPSGSPSEAHSDDPSSESGAFVYRLAGDRVQLTRVRVGRSTATTVEIVHGLAVRDRVVVGRTVALGDGERVDAKLRPSLAAAQVP